MMEVGLRVVRGPDWKWANQDDGEGHVGTVVEIGKPGSTTSPDKTVVVQWDSGSRTNYRVGYQGAYDLRVLDNAPVGVKHPNHICDACKKQGLQGIRWKCLKCFDFDLCTQCYCADKHDLTHPFLRFDTASSTGVKVPKRVNAAKVKAMGIFSGAKVVRGPDWDWGSQDGGEGKVGKVIDIRGWDTESGRSVANITWSSGSTNVYRLGHKGKVDLKYVQDASGGYYYRDHLPVLGETIDIAASGIVPCQFKVGDKVRVDLEVEILKAMQEGHGGWNPRMQEYIGKVGTVHRITERGDVRVQYEGCSNRWTFHAGALTKVHQFAIGDFVKIIEQAQKVRELQKGHGEWTDNMKSALGKTGKVLKIYGDGDLRVQVTGATWTFNPMCCVLAPHTQQDANNTMSHSDREEHTTNLSALLEHFLETPSLSTEPERLVREAAQGHLAVVRDIITKFPERVDQKSSGKTALQVASHQGHLEIVRFLIEARANMEIQDEDGDTALHYSAFGNKAEITELLLSKMANINALNNGGCSALHVAVNKQHTRCVKVLIRHKCDVNVQDSYGDTALHDAIGKENREIVELLVNYNGVDFTLKNKRGFNVLHHSALKGNVHATDKILTKARQVADVKKDDGFAALHLAALNGHSDVAQVLIKVGQADIEIRNNRRQTPLLLAVSQGHSSLTELLVESGADVNAEDEDGDTPLHLSLIRQTGVVDPDTSPALTSVTAQINLPESDITASTVIACYLVQKGADLFHKNHQGKTSLCAVTDSRVGDAIKAFAAVCSASPNTGQSNAPEEEADAPGTASAECMVCSDDVTCVKFEPCGHRIVCAECCVKMKKCLVCMQPILKKIGRGGLAISPQHSSASPETTKVRELQMRLQEMEDTINCSICMENKRTVAFLCGHSACNTCAQPLKQCHMCRKPITRTIPLFN